MDKVERRAGSIGEDIGKALRKAIEDVIAAANRREPLTPFFPEDDRPDSFLGEMTMREQIDSVVLTTEELIDRVNKLEHESVEFDTRIDELESNANEDEILDEYARWGISMKPVRDADQSPRINIFDCADEDDLIIPTNDEDDDPRDARIHDLLERVKIQAKTISDLSDDKKKYDEERDNGQHLIKIVEAVTAENDKLARQIEGLELSLYQEQQKSKELQEQIDNGTGLLTPLGTDELERLRDEIEKLKVERGKWQDCVFERDQTIERLRDDNAGGIKAVKILQLANADYQSENDDLREQVEELTTTILAERKNFENQIRANVSSIDNLERERADLISTIAQLREDRDEEGGIVFQLRQMNQGKDNLINELQEEVGRLTQDITELNTRLQPIVRRSPRGARG